ncbi:Deoxyribose-phosphate aldolase 1 [Propionicimonas sp. T2.31MG-18]|uniref:deoxyribose-phosphate aldolase n=1 Tax=Propionicimonas sp. T2.31MG-18 TaxID=3157620 RepID=UPI0035F0B7A4
MKPIKPAAEMTADELAVYIDHSVLKPEFTPDEIRHEVENAALYKCKTACINPSAIELAAPILAGTDTGICVVVDFPFGCSSTASKVAQTMITLEQGIQELDIVANLGWIRGGELKRVEDDLRAVIDPCHAAGVPVKVIFETDALTISQIKAVAEASIAAGADFIKTSTGFYTGTNMHEKTGASDEMVALMMECAAGRAKVKGSGSIRDRAHFLRLIDAGIDRMGIGYRSTPIVLGLVEAAPAGASALVEAGSY